MMFYKQAVSILVLSCLWISSKAYKVGLIYKKGDNTTASIVEGVFYRNIDKYGSINVQFVKEEAQEEDTRSYHRAFCRLLASGIDAFISPADSPYYSLLSDYANEYQIPFISPELPQSISISSNNYSYGMQPITTRVMLRLFQIYQWSDVVYLYDHDDGPENLNFMFAVGSRVLNLTLNGMLKVTSAEEANEYLQKLDNTLRNNLFHVVLDTDSDMAYEIIRRHVHDIHVRKMNFHFALSKPIMEEFWNTHMMKFGAVNITSFIIKKQTISSESEEFANIKDYYYYDAALLLNQAWKLVMRNNSRGHHAPFHPIAAQTLQHQHQVIEPALNCLESRPTVRPKGIRLSKVIKEIMMEGTTGRIQFENGQRKDFDLYVNEVTSTGFREIGFWSKGILYSSGTSRRLIPTSLPLIQERNRLQIVSVISPPYMMLRTGENLRGNERYEGYCKDMIDLLAQEMDFEYDLHIVEDGTYGIYKKSEGTWSGMIGELIEGKADLAVADLTITGQRQRVVDFTDPYEMVGFSVVVKNPRNVSKLSTIWFFLSAFTVDTWICIIFAVILFCVLFHFITKFTGAPDSIESASGIWGRKHTVVANMWFVMGTSMLQGTGVYPRSLSSRILSGFFWFFTLILSSMFIASIATQIITGRLTDENSPQLSQLKALSLESIVRESVSRGWPRIGLIHPSHLENFTKNSNLPVYAEFVKYLEKNPDVLVNSKEEGLERVRNSNGDYMVLLESPISEYAIRRKPCDLITIHDTVVYAGYGLATPLGSSITPELNRALHKIQAKGSLGDFYRKWWIDSSECKNVIVEKRNERSIHVFSGLLCVSAIGFIILIAVFAVQYIRRNQSKESRRQQLSFEDMNLGQSLPTPPPELLAEPAPMLNLPEYDKRTLL